MKQAASSVLGKNLTRSQGDSILHKAAYTAQFVYYFTAYQQLQRAKVFHLYIDGSSIGGSPSELAYLWSPELGRGAYAPVYATWLASSATQEFLLSQLFKVSLNLFHGWGFLEQNDLEVA